MSTKPYSDYSVNDIAALVRMKDGAYTERNLCLSLATKLALKAGIRAYLAIDETQEPEWKNLVVIDLPTGQASWHVHASEITEFAHLKMDYEYMWDGHSNEEKYGRVKKCTV